MSASPAWYGWPPVVDVDAVSSVFGRTGAVVAVAGDYGTTKITNQSGVTGATDTDALNNLNSAIALIVNAIGNLNSTDIANVSAVSGATVTAALNALASGAGVTSVFGRAGAVLATAGDYGTTKITNQSGVAGATNTDALNVLLAAIAALTSSGIANSSSVVGATVTAALNTLLAALTVSQTFWAADAAPTSPSSKDDEFPAGAINAKWSTWDVGSVLTKSINNNHLFLRATGNGSDRWCGLYQAVPASEFAIYTKMGQNGQSANFGESAIFVADDLVGAPGTADFRTVEYTLGSALNEMFTRTWSAWNGSAGTSTNNNGFLAPYVRMRCNGTTCASDYSLDGVNWVQLASVTLGFTPLYMGLGIDITQNAVERGSRFKFFRCFSGAGTSGFDATSIGNFI